MKSDENFKISIVMATFNGEAFLAEQLDSILAQSYPIYEIVICDDWSSDGTLSTLKDYQSRFADKIKVFVNESKLGCAKNFEKAISLASGDIIFLADQDDVWMANKVEKMLTLFAVSENVKGVFANSRVVDENLKDMGFSHWEARGFVKDELLTALSRGAKEQLAVFLKRVPIAGHNMAFRADCRAMLLPFPNLESCHDTWIGMFFSALHQWGFVAEELTMFRQHSSNHSKSGAKKGFIGQLTEAKKSIKDNSFAWNAELYHDLIERVGSYCPKDIIELLNSRQKHSLARAEMNCGFFRRLPMIIREIKNRGYFQYARGWKSVIQDLFLRNGKY